MFLNSYIKISFHMGTHCSILEVRKIFTEKF
uniref:Uncharacterized protein n=1 Tax=Arundo donax TaxID=35708 RepID=A0A0A9AE53_ARUDO